MHKMLRSTFLAYFDQQTSVNYSTVTYCVDWLNPKYLCNHYGRNCIKFFAAHFKILNFWILKPIVKTQ